MNIVSVNIKLLTNVPQCLNFKFQILIQNVSIVVGISIDITRKESMLTLKYFFNFSQGVEKLDGTQEKEVLDGIHNDESCQDIIWFVLLSSKLFSWWLVMFIFEAWLVGLKWFELGIGVVTPLQPADVEGSDWYCQASLLVVGGILSWFNLPETLGIWTWILCWGATPRDSLYLVYVMYPIMAKLMMNQNVFGMAKR